MIKPTPTGYIHTMDDSEERARQLGELGLPKAKPRPQMVAALLILKEANSWVGTRTVAKRMGSGSNAWGILNRLVKHKLAMQRVGNNNTSEWRAL